MASNRETRPKTFFESLSPFYKFAKIQGLATFSAHKTESQSGVELRNSYLQKLYGICIVLLHFPLTGFLIVDSLEDSSFAIENLLSTYIFMTWMFIIIANIITIIALMTPKYQDNFSNFFQKIGHVDSVLLTGATAYYRKFEIFLTLQVIVLLCLLFLLSSLDSHTYSTNDLLYFYHFVSGMIVNSPIPTTSIFFTNLVLLTKTRFRVLNFKLEKLEATGDSGTDSRTTAQSSRRPQRGQVRFAKSLSQLRGAHLSLCEAVAHLNDAYEVQLLTFVSVGTLSLLYELYVALDAATYTEDMAAVFVVCRMLSTMVGALMVFAVLASCSAMYNEAERTALMVQGLQASAHSGGADGSSHDAHELRCFAAQLKERESSISIRACGLFRLDLSLASTLVQGVVCYALIMTQCKSSYSIF